MKTDGEEDDDDEENGEDDDDTCDELSDEDEQIARRSSIDNKQRHVATNYKRKQQHANKPHNNSNQSTNDSACSSDLDIDSTDANNQLIKSIKPTEQVETCQQQSANKDFLTFSHDYKLWNDSSLLGKNLVSNLGLH